MNKTCIIILFLFNSVFNLYAQIPFNPFNQNIHFEPEPTVEGFECGTTQNVEFTQGLTTANDATDFLINPLKIIICIEGFTFNGLASAVATGTYASNFTWAYDLIMPNCIIGTQNQILFGTGTDPISPNPLASGDINLSLLVPENSPANTVLSVNVTLQVPPYMAMFNSTPDDLESTQTQTFCTILPIDLVKFDATQLENKISVNWKASGEKNFSHFDLQRSSDAKEFHSVKSIYLGNTDYYSYEDFDPITGINYYRLKMIDLDGSQKFSKIISLNFEKGKKYTFIENPSLKNEIKIHTNNKDTVFKLFSTNGSPIEIEVESNSNNIYNLIAKKYTPGLYFLKIITNNQVETKKIILN